MNKAVTRSLRETMRGEVVMEPAFRILNLEDDPLDTDLVRALLLKDGLPAEIDRVDALSGFREALVRGGYKLILADYSIPGMDASEALRLARETRPELPFIFLSGTIGEETAVEMLKRGASDYLLKQRMERLGPAVRRALHEAEEHAHIQRSEKERDITIEFLRLVNDNAGTRQLIEAAVRFFHEQSGCEAVGIRLRKGDDYPYYEARGFPEEFIHLENSLCVQDPEGTIQRDNAGIPVMACMCGNVIRGRYDPSKPFFTTEGSFWTNDTSRLLATKTGADPQTPARNRCNDEGYESVALIALRCGEERLGLLQLNDRRRGMFTQEIISFWERLGGYLGIALAKTVADENLRESETRLRETNATLEQKVQERTEELSRRAAQLRALTGELTLSEERERGRLAKILHDQVQQLLVAAKFRTAVLGRSGDDSVKQATNEIERLIDESILASRSLTAELSPPILHEAGLNAGLEWLSRRMADQQGLSVEMELEKIDLMPDDLKILLFESVRELLFNIAKHAHTRSSLVKLKQIDGLLQVTVSDQGCGFDPNVMARVSESGQGFGLFSIRERLELFGGRMEIQSAPGQGSRMSLFVPMPQGSAAWSDPTKVAMLPAIPIPERIPMQVSGKRIRIILADDHAVVRHGIASMLSDEPDFEIVSEAADGQEAVELARRFLPDIILMDMSMPKLNGVEATRIIHDELPEIRIIGLSMYEDAERNQVMREAGAVHYMTKSGAADALIAAVRKYANNPEISA